MQARRLLVLVMGIVVIAGTAAADLKVVKMAHTDGFSAMGRETPPSDTEQVTWIGTDRMRMDQGQQSTIIRLDLQKLFILNHDKKTFHTLDLPVDLKQILPPGMADQMLAMMTFDVTVTPSDETKMIGEWKARRYDVSMVSKMATANMTMWATKDTSLDQEAFNKMYEHLNSMNPGMQDMAQQMRKIEGLVIEQETVTTMNMMGDVTIKRSEKTSSIEKLSPPDGAYDPPVDYTEQPFDFMESMQK